MRALLTALSFALAVPLNAALAGDQPVIIELYTSQGCSSCPPADKLLAEMAQRDDVLPLALHVDYWDYIGWPDNFADARFTARQKAYARLKGERMIYTPQAVVAGQAAMIGSKAAEIEAAVARHKAAPDVVQVSVVSQGAASRIVVRMAEGQDPRPMLIQVVPFLPRARIDIRGGENEGTVLDYVNIVTDWQVVGEWDGQGSWEGAVSVVPPAAVVVQEANGGPGAILGAQRID